MSRLDKLMIQGIRSFSPNDKNILEFHMPLTLIVGANGTGKTTIIECLKYITTGDMPPNSRGGAFIYDPKLAREIDVKAEVRLRFINNKNEALVCTRSMQSSLKKSKTEQKTLDSTLSKEVGGKSILLTSKLGDIDKGIPGHLGVSHSILENVIFCHQDESIWPLGDPTVMKKKLDDVFSSTKYNKALLGLKGSKKEVSADLKLKIQHISFLLKEKLKRDDIMKSIQQYHADIEKKNQKLRVFEEEGRRILSNIELVENGLKLFEKLERNHKLLIVEFESCKKFINSFGFEILANFDRESALDSIEVLGKKLSSLYQTIIEEEFSKVEQLRRTAMEEMSRNKEILKNIEQNEAALLGLAEEKRSLAEYLVAEFPCSENELSEKSRETFGFVENSIQEKADDLEKHRERLFLLKSQQAEAEKILREHRVFIEKHRDLEKADIDIDCPVEVDYDKQMELEAIVDELLEEVNSKQSKLNEAYKLSEGAFKKTHMLEHIDKLRMCLEKDSVAQLNSKIATASVLLKNKRAILKSLEHEQQHLKILSDQKESHNRKVINEILFLSEQLPAISENQPSGRSTENRPNEKSKLILGLLALATIREDFPYELLEIEEAKNIDILQTELDDCKNAMAANAHASAVYMNFCRLGEKKNECPLCKKGLECEERDAFVNRLEKVIAKIPESTRNAESKKNGLEQTIADLKKHNSEIDHRNSIRLKIKKLLEEIDNGMPDTCLNDAVLVEEEVMGLEKSFTDLRHRLEQSTTLSEQLSSLESECSRLPDSVDLESIKGDFNRTKSLLECRRAELASFNSDLKLKEKMLKSIEAERENRKIIQRRDELIEESRSTKSVDLKELEDIVQKKESKLDKLRKTFIRKKMEVEMKIARLDQVKSLILEKETQIVKLRGQLSADNAFVYFGSRKITVGALKSDQEFEKIRSVVMDHKNEIIRLTRDLEREKHSLKTIDENIKLRKSKEKVLEIESELKNLDMKKYAQLKEKHASYVEQRAKISNHESIIRGELKQMVHVLKSLNTDIDSNYKDTCRNYLKSSVEIKALELSLEDLEKCINGLDKAIVDFHSSKIDEVNRVLRDLWSSTYRGNDIEYIELKSESSETRAYNYRIVMVKSGVELDMRGRSSAGQKMIASILFRIALADSFSCGCNVLALDEPTTNLDRDNIESLAYTLSQIIKERSNVQMIIITHDEEFVQMLNREGTEYFYRLRRDPSGNGHIEQHSIYK